MEKLKLHSPDITQANIEKLAQIFPNCVVETRDISGGSKRSIDFDQLRQELSTSLVEGPQERYQLNWPGKREALLTANAPIAKTLRPCREESVDFDTTKNLFIEGDNLDALKLLQETYLNKVKLIYIDPPYNTGNDFIYDDDFSQDSETYKLRSNQKDVAGRNLVLNMETNGRFHSDWLSMIYSRLKLARNLLKDDGIIFVSIDDGESENLLLVMNEIFGAKNFIGTFVVNSTPNGRDYGHIAKMHDYVHFYCKDIELAKTNQLEVKEKKFRFSDKQGGFNVHPLYNSNEAFTSQNRPNLFYPIYLYPLENQTDCFSQNNNELADCFYKIGFEKIPGSIEIYPPKSEKNGVQFVWRWGKPKSAENFNVEITGYKTESGDYRIVQKMRHTEKLVRSLLDASEFTSRRGTAEVEAIFEGKIASFPKPLELIKTLIQVGSDIDDTVLDFFSGSCTTAHAVMALNAETGSTRRYVMVQLPEECDEKSEASKSGYKTVAEVGKERIRRTARKIKSESGITNPDLDIGFRVLKIDSSNMKEVFYAPDAVSQDLLSDQVNNIREDRSSEDLLFQVLLDWGVDLSLPIAQETIAGKTVYFVDGNALAACFEDGVSEEFVKLLAKREPLRAVFRDSGFVSDSVKINVEQIFKLTSPSTEVKAI